MSITIAQQCRGVLMLITSFFKQLAEGWCCLKSLSPWQQLCLYSSVHGEQPGLQGTVGRETPHHTFLAALPLVSGKGFATREDGFRDILPAGARHSTQISFFLARDHLTSVELTHRAS